MSATVVPNEPIRRLPRQFRADGRRALASTGGAVAPTPGWAVRPVITVGVARGYAAPRFGRPCARFCAALGGAALTPMRRVPSLVARPLPARTPGRWPAPGRAAPGPFRRHRAAGG